MGKPVVFWYTVPIVREPVTTFWVMVWAVHKWQTRSSVASVKVFILYLWGRSAYSCASVNSRNPSLDVLRGLAILLVIAFHLDPFVIFRIGFIGVDLFFVLSGFLISGLLFRDVDKYGQVRLRRFWVRRAFKILPPLYIFLALIAPVMLAFKIFPTRTFFTSIFFLSNYLADSGRGGSMVGHTWSLAIEEHFYLFLPLLLWLLIRAGRGVRWVPSIFAVVAVSCFVFRCLDPQHWAFTHLRADGLFAGVALRYLEQFRTQWFAYFRRPYALVIGLTFWIFPYSLRASHPVLRSLMYSWVAISFTALVGWSFAHDGAGLWRFPGFRLLARIGVNSYSIYLWQAPLCFIAIVPGWGYKVAGFVLSISVGMIMARLVEAPALAWRDKYFGRGLMHVPAHQPDIDALCCDRNGVKAI
jgi:peptidoglycan/LPS O-acetylase OafA/YrhL